MATPSKMAKSSIFLLLVALILEVALGQKQLLKVRGRARPKPKSFAPVPVEPLVSSCPEPIGLQLYPDPATCNRFFKCANGTLTHETCENGLLFDKAKAFAGAAHNHCSYHWDTDCDTRPAEDTPISTPGCLYQFGVFPVDEGCHPDYVTCAFGIPTTVACDLGLVYQDSIHACNYPDQLIEELGCNPSSLLGGFTCPHPDDLTPLARRFFPYPRFAVQGREDLYIICVDNQPRLQSCGAAAIFDAASLSCLETF